MLNIEWVSSNVLSKLFTDKVERWLTSCFKRTSHKLRHHLFFYVKFPLPSHINHLTLLTNTSFKELSFIAAPFGQRFAYKRTSFYSGNVLCRNRPSDLCLLGTELNLPEMWTGEYNRGQESSGSHRHECTREDSSSRLLWCPDCFIPAAKESRIQSKEKNKRFDAGD